MKIKAVSGIMLTVLLVGTLGLMFNVGVPTVASKVTLTTEGHEKWYRERRYGST